MIFQARVRYASAMPNFERLIPILRALPTAEQKRIVAYAKQVIDEYLEGTVQSSAPTRRRNGVRRPAGGRRSPEQVGRDMKRILSYIKKHPGQRSEEIGEGLGMATKQLQLPLRKLCEEELVEWEGQRRGTRYSAA